jgi:hypothetical protein
MTKLLLILLFPLTSFAVDCKSHKIYCHIKKVKPTIEHNFAMELSNLIYQYSKKYKTNPRVSVCIGLQETRLQVEHRKDRVVTGFDHNNKPIIVEGITDFNIFQIHLRTAENYKLNIYRLYHDFEYAVWAHFHILAKKIKKCKKLDKNAWTCYHSFNETTRLIYKKMVEKNCGV